MIETDMTKTRLITKINKANIKKVIPNALLYVTFPSSKA